ncbi:hypothetical protein [Methanosarcina sp. MTP4]|uniref:hypothetical protein n=1 Tax=Methanosarcina sp. MTP4 TaxID=1434100 RepID=UPI001E283717|nr:hypothetical protein [Methanosarcina sp. MTP4]
MVRKLIKSGFTSFYGVDELGLLNKIMAVALLCFFLIMLLIMAPLAFTTIEPLYTIKNYDEHPHNATVKITGYNGEYFEETYYQLNPGQTVSVGKPKKLLLKWSNPFKEGYLHYASGDYHYYIESGNVSASYYSTPHLTNTVIFELVNYSGEFNVSIMEYT